MTERMEKEEGGRGEANLLPQPTSSSSPPPSPPISTARLTAVIYILGVLKMVGKYLPSITMFFAALNAILAIYDVSTQSWGWAAVHIFFAAASAIFLVQLYQRHRIHSSGYYRGIHSVHYPRMARIDDFGNNDYRIDRSDRR
ncbi:hypothetical protein [Nitrososphaera sp.]|uniref:hypothetical protein n=1 Tax=Nitrososphaera sp. TaxID=1971748 RepID=UPI00307E50EC